MSVITGFESEVPSEQTEEAQKSKIDYGQVFEALKHDEEVAENVFARNAKQDFRDRIGDRIVRKALEDAGDLLPSWVTQSSVTLPMKGEDDYVKHCVITLAELVGAMAEEVNTLLGDADKAIMVGPLNTTIRYTGADRVTFRLKQRWARE